MNQSVFVGQGGEHPVRVRPGATRAFSLSVSLVSVQSSFYLSPTAPFCLALFSLGKGKAQSRSRSRSRAPGKRRFVWPRFSPSLVIFFFFLSFFFPGHPRYCCHPCCSSSSTLLPASLCVPSAFALIAAVISGRTHIAMLPTTCYGRTARQSWVLPLSKLSLDGTLL